MSSSSSHRRKDATVRLSKSLAYTLRHGAQKEGLNVRSDGYVVLDDLMRLPRFKGRTFEEIEYVVKNNDKQRFNLTEISVDGSTTRWFIRANQGHSIEVKELELEKITDPQLVPQVIHGTRFSKWESIKSQGLSKMNRNHIHFAIGRWGDSNVISGVRATCDLFIYISLAKALADGIEFYRSANGVILSSGIDGTLPIKYFARVEDASGKVLFSSEELAESAK